MAHVGSTYEYCQIISAHIKEQNELVTPFPLSKQPFGRLELSETEHRYFHTQATELLGSALKEYEEFVLIRHRQVDRLRWKPLKSHENLTVYRESRSYAVEDENAVARAATTAPTSFSRPYCTSRSSLSSGGSGPGSISLPAHQVTELELLTGWGPTATEARERKMRAKSKSVSANSTLKQMPTLLGVGNIIGSLEDVMYGVAAPDCASMALNNAYLHEDVLDGDVLAAIEAPTQRSPFRFLGIKWLVKSTMGGNSKHKVVSPRDLVYLEATGMITRGDGVRIGYQVMHSVKLRGCPELSDSHGVIRARCESVHLFIELDTKTVDVFLKSNVTPNGRISESAVMQSCADSLLFCGKTVQSSQNKKLAWQLECVSNLRRARGQEKKGKATHCSVCNKTFNRILRHSFECNLCSSAMCSKCCVERTLKSVDASGENRHTNKSVSTIVVELCTSCVAANLQKSALMLAREEVTSGRFGRVSNSLLHSRGSDNSGEGISSLGTIALEDIPGQREHHTRPPRRSEGSTRKCYQSRENRRSHREQGSSREGFVLGNSGKDQQNQCAYGNVPESLPKRGNTYRESPPSHPSKHRDPPKIRRTRSGSHDFTSSNMHAHQPTFRRGRSGEVRCHMQRAEDGIRSDRNNDNFAPPESNLGSRHNSVYNSTPLKLNNMERGDRGMAMYLCDLEGVSPYKFSKESIRNTTSSSESSLAAIDVAGMDVEEPEVEEHDIESRGTFDSFSDLLEIHDDLDDVYETLDTKDMAAVKRSSQVNSRLWKQIAELRDAAENVYQYTKESTAMHVTQGGSIRSPECALGGRAHP
ncbi:unnamed protein product [Peronospora belbahrii]|uniref:FYVE-type domain-containing protein n=1 Tax=Peronospora belbahrii TaxID=622444 RepID=A0AAU9KMD2_9STRA|nr:unnamed protein product [Peronospora belbahrii]CAH0513383.1 unnamed protein product [Peronospora belbahrii]